MSGATSDQQGRFRLDGLPKISSYRLLAGAREGDQPYISSRADCPGSARATSR